MNDAIEFHDTSSAEFLAQYGQNADFVERLAIWKDVLGTILKPGMNALELGCGGGQLATWAVSTGVRVVAVDGSEKMISAAQKLAGEKQNSLSFLHKRLPDEIPESPFDAVYASSFIEYLELDRKVDDWLVSLVKPGGYLAFSLPNKTSLYRKWEAFLFGMLRRPKYLSHVKRKGSLKEIQSVMNGHGFDLVEHRYFGTRPLLSRWASALLPKQYAANMILMVFKRKEGN